jgi:hypothetical protein
MRTADTAQAIQRALSVVEVGCSEVPMAIVAVDTELHDAPVHLAPPIRVSEELLVGVEGVQVKHRSADVESR